MDKYIKNAVVIGRFQINDLHLEHQYFLGEVTKKSERLIIFLGTSVTKGTRKYPLDFETRKLMVQSYAPDAEIYPLPDFKENKDWSNNLDNTLLKLNAHTNETILFGSRDSFIPSYLGNYKTEIITPRTEAVSATQVREEMAKQPIDSPDFRAGVIYSCYNRYPLTHNTVDVAIFNEDYTKLLLGKKPNEKLLRFIGGFVDTTDANLETACRREAAEETGLVIDGMEYINSFNINDWRYRNSGDRILTTLFKGKVIMGHEKANDDIESLTWVDIVDVQPEELEVEHRQLLIALKQKMGIELELKTE